MGQRAMQQPRHYTTKARNKRKISFLHTNRKEAMQLPMDGNGLGYHRNMFVPPGTQHPQTKLKKNRQK